MITEKISVDSVYAFLNAFSRFRTAALKHIEQIDREKIGRDGVARYTDNTSLSPSLGHDGLSFSVSVSLELQNGSLSWGLDGRLIQDYCLVAGRLSGNYFEDPYQTILRPLGEARLESTDADSKPLNDVIETVLSDLRQTLESTSLLELHREGQAKPFFPNL